MPDVFEPAKRSEVMTRIRSKDTVAELIVFRYLRKEGIYYQKHYVRAAGKPDVALPRKRKAVFIDSDFWHGKTYDKVLQHHAPDSYWVKKIARNIERDKQQRGELLNKGWQVLVVWEEDIKRKRTRETELTKIKRFLTSDFFD